MDDSHNAPERLETTSTDPAGNTRATASGVLARFTYCIRQRDFRLLFMLFLFMLFWYSALLKLSPTHIKLDLTFNSMLDHLLHGQFDVDSGIVGSEGFQRNGHVYAYWGIWCALLRLPLWILDRMNTDITKWSCLAAVCLAAMVKVRTVLLLRGYGAEDKTAKHAVGMILAYIVLGGSEVGYLKATIYQEVILWAIAFATLFVYFTIKGLIAQSFELGTLSAMALWAGLALLTRASTGIGLILAFGLLLLVLAWQTGATIGRGDRWTIRYWLQTLLSRRILVPLGILAVCIVATGAVNYCRWGNPLTFANFRLYLCNIQYPDRVLRDSVYGMFSIRRIPLALIYYFLPLWAIQSGAGQFLFEHAQTRLFDCIELPPSTFFLTDLLPLCFIALLIVALCKRRSGGLLPVRQWAAIAVGLAFPGILMLTYSYLTYRYRMEFYPEIDFLAFLGLYMVLVDDRLRSIYARRRVWIEAALIVSVVASFAALLLYSLAPFGPVLHTGFGHSRYFVWF
jgi:hypothetical protein